MLNLSVAIGASALSSSLSCPHLKCLSPSRVGHDDNQREPAQSRKKVPERTEPPRPPGPRGGALGPDFRVFRVEAQRAATYARVRIFARGLVLAIQAPIG